MLLGRDKIGALLSPANFIEQFRYRLSIFVLPATAVDAAVAAAAAAVVAWAHVHSPFVSVCDARSIVRILWLNGKHKKIIVLICKLWAC